MMTFLRSQSQTVLIVILGFLALGFLFYGNSGNFFSSAGGPTDYGRIDGEDVTLADLDGAVRNERTSNLLFNRSQQQPTATDIANNAWTRLLLLHEADKLHIDVSDDELIANIQSQPQFQKDGVYSPDLYRDFSNYLQTQQHVSSDAYAGLLHDQMRIAAVYRALFSTIHASGGDADARYQKEYGPVQVSYVSFSPSAFTAAAKVTPAEVEAAYKADPMNPAYRTDEKRQVEYVLFPLTAEQQKLPDKDKNAAIQAVGQKALDFALALQPDPNAASGATPPPADFQAEAKKDGMTPVTTDFFAANASPGGLPPSPAFNNAAFALSKDDSISKVVQLDNGVVVMHLLQIQASEIKPLADVTPVITKQLQAQKGAQEAQLEATVAATTLKAQVAKGGDFKAAAAAQHLTVQTVPNFVPHDAPQNDQRMEALAYFSAQLAVGDVSEPIPMETDNSVVVLHVDSRAPADQAGLATFEKTFSDSQDDQLREAALQDWATWMDRQRGTHPPAHLEAYGAAE